MTFSKKPSSSFGGKRRSSSDESSWEARETRALVRLSEVGNDEPLRFERTERTPRTSTGDGSGVTRSRDETKGSRPRGKRPVANEDGEVRSSSKWAKRVDVPDENGEVRSTTVRAKRLSDAQAAADAAAASPEGSARKTKMERKAPSAQSYALWLLSRRDYSEKELRQKLAFKDHLPADIDAAIQKVQTLGYQSDARFVDVQTRQKANVAGDRKLRMQMKTKGVDEELVDEALTALPDESTRAFEAMRRFRGKTVDAKMQQKAYRFLAGRGFSFTSIKFAWEHTFGKAAVEELADLDVGDD